jgi:hypothetical protein
VEVLEARRALEPLVAAMKLVATVKTAMKSVSTIPASAARISFRTIGHLAPSKLPPLL